MAAPNDRTLRRLRRERGPDLTASALPLQSRHQPTDPEHAHSAPSRSRTAKKGEVRPSFELMTITAQPLCRTRLARLEGHLVVDRDLGSDLQRVICEPGVEVRARDKSGLGVGFPLPMRVTACGARPDPWLRRYMTCRAGARSPFQFGPSARKQRRLACRVSQLVQRPRGGAESLAGIDRPDARA